MRRRTCNWQHHVAAMIVLAYAWAFVDHQCLVSVYASVLLSTGVIVWTCMNYVSVCVNVKGCVYVGVHCKYMCKRDLMYMHVSVEVCTCVSMYLRPCVCRREWYVYTVYVSACMYVCMYASVPVYTCWYMCQCVYKSEDMHEANMKGNSQKLYTGKLTRHYSISVYS